MLSSGGLGSVSFGIPEWMLYALGIGLVLLVILAGFKLFKLLGL
jgi:hypothetical protein